MTIYGIPKDPWRKPYVIRAPNQAEHPMQRKSLGEKLCPARVTIDGLLALNTSLNPVSMPVPFNGINIPSDELNFEEDKDASHRYH